MNSTTVSPPPIDEPTASAIQQALAAARSGRLADACRTVEQALATGGDRIALNALAGMLRHDLGDHEAAIRHLEVARAGRPNDVRIATNLASALTAAGNLDRAFEVATRDLAFADPTLQLARIRGYAAQMTGRYDESVEAYEHVVNAVPGDWESLNNLGNARMYARSP